MPSARKTTTPKAGRPRSFRLRSMTTKDAAMPSDRKTATRPRSPLLPLFALTLAVFAASALLAPAAAQQDTRPYRNIATPLPDTLDQLYRDSATVKIGRVRVNQAGYRPGDDKFFYYIGSSASSFTVIDAGTGASAATGTLTSKNVTSSGQIKIRASNNAQIVAGGDTRYTMQSAAVSGTVYEGKIDVSAPGRYRVRVGGDTSAPFWIHEDVYGWVRDAAIKFPGVNRCGDSESWFHGACHLKDATLGGWHDCGDHLKEGITQSYLHAMLALGSAALREHDVDNYGRNHNNTLQTDGVPDVLYEAKHGSDYIIRAYDNAGGQVARMVTSVANFGHDHQWWGQPEMQDRMSVERGGPPREARIELGANILGLFAAGLALTAKNYAVFDAAHAAKSVTVAKALYAYAKANLKNTESPAYNGNGETQDKLAFAALGLLYATKDKTYLNDLCYNTSIYNAGSSAAFPNFGFDGGWFAKQPQFSKGFANTDWGSQHIVVLWGFYRLILKDEGFCADVGITADERLKLLGKTAGQMLFGLNEIGSNAGNAGTIALPSIGHWDSYNGVNVKYDDMWKSMLIQQEWMWNRYQFGNIFDLFAYSDMAMWLDDTGLQLPGRSGANWKGREVRQLVIRQMDYMLGVNPWDYSMIFGVGNKNSNHPHHRAANPEGKNVPGNFYPYRPPVGALQAGVSPAIQGGIYSEHYDDYRVTETGIDASATMLIPLMGLALPDPITDPPEATVRTVYVGADQAIIEVRQSRYGTSTIRYAVDGVTTFTSVQADSAGMFHRIVLTNLKPGTKYNFDALVADLYGKSNVIKDDRGEYFSFTTLAAPPGKAEISNVKVCKVTSDSAEIFWYTPNGSYDSRVVYGDKKPPATVHDGNIYGRPSQFHYVKIGGLKEKTTYYFYVENNGTRDDNGGQYYTFTTPVEHVEFDIRALKYSDQFFGFNIVNQDVKDYDSLEVRIYVRMPDTLAIPPSGDRTNGRVAFSDYIGFRLDIGIKYRSDAYQGEHFKTVVDDIVQAARPIRIEDTYDPRDSTWAFYIPIPLGPVKMESGARFRLDMMLDTRSTWKPYQDLMNVSPSADILSRIWRNAWSFIPHSRANGDPADYPGVPSGAKEDIDNVYFSTPVDRYITVYRKNEFIWGYSPSASEQQTKKTHYEMTSQITSPLYNPAEEYLFIEQVMPQITVSGWAKITENGVVNDIWVNGSKVRDVNSVAKYDFAADRWNLAIPVPVKNGGNNIDITIFGGPENECATCYGCAFTNHSFYLEFRGADPYPSSLKLLSGRDISSAEIKDSARIDETRFYVYVDDKNGDLNKDRRDTVRVSVVNPVTGDSLSVPLVETGDTTGKFISVNSVSVVSTPSGANAIFMDGGQTVVVTYVDVTDPGDVSSATLASRAEFAVPVSAYFKDSAGIGSIDAVYVKYSKIPDILPDSLHLTFPGASGVRAVKAPGDGIAADANDRSLVRFALNPAIGDVTGFKANEQMTARSFLRYGGAVKEAVVPVQDKAGPALLYRALLLERSGGAADTVEVTLSEPMPGAGLIGGTLVLRRGGADIGLAVSAALDSSLLTNSLTLLISTPLNDQAGGGKIMEGDSIFINPIGPAADRAGNRAHNNNRPVPVLIKSATPRITAASYKDEDADGMIDMVELTLSKPLDLAGLRLWLSWEGGKFVLVEWSSLSADESETVVRAGIKGLLTGDSVITSGKMNVMAAHNKFPGDTLRAVAADKAAPAVKRAQFRPGAAGEKDSLAVTFSEPLLVASARPFAFRHGPDGALYGMTLQNDKPSAVSHTHIFIVSSIEGPQTAPTKEDSLWIDTEASVYDTSANIQSNAGNRRVKLAIKPAPITVKVIPAPSPYRLAVKYSGDPPARIIVRPTAKALGDLTLRGVIAIYDKVGGLVLADTLKPQPDTPDLVYLWDGHSKRGRRAGTGTYLITVSVEHAGEEYEERAKAVTGKALMYILR